MKKPAIAAAWVPAVLVLLWQGAPGGADEGPEAVYYRVTYDDGTSRDLAGVPDTDEGIERVVRIERHATGYRTHEVLSTGRTTLTVSNAKRTVRREMEWNGAEWVKIEPDEAGAAGAADLAGEVEFVVEDPRRLRHVVAGLELRVEQLSKGVSRAEASLKEAVGTPDEPAARATLDALRRDLGECRDVLDEYEQRLRAAQSLPPAVDAGDGDPEARRLERRLRELRGRLALFELATVDAEGELFAAAGTGDAHAARWDLEAIRGIREALEAEIAATEARLAKLHGPAGPE